MPTQAYRLRIRSADNTTDTLVITSVRGGTNPYISSVPSGDGQEVDLLSGAVRTGAYVVEVVDAVVGSDTTGTLRIVTQNLYDGIEEYLLLENGDKILLENGDPIELELNNAEFGQPHLLSRKAFLEMSTDGGSNWTVWQSGYLTNVRQVDAIRYAFTISNTRRVEQTKQLFTWSSNAEQTAFPQRGCVVGGPVIGGFGVGGDKTIDSGGWEFAFLGTSGSSSAPKKNDIVSLAYEAGYFWPSWERKKIPGPGQAANFWNTMLPYRVLGPGDKSLVGDTFRGLNNQDIVPTYPRLLAVVSYTVGGVSYTVKGTVRCFFPYHDGDPFTTSNGFGELREGFGKEVFNRLFVQLDAPLPATPTTPWDALPSADTICRVRLVAREVDESSPLYIDLHPVEIAEKLYDLIGLTVDSGSVTTVKSAIGVNTRLAMRVTGPQTMAEFMETALFGPFGFAARVTEKVVGGVLTSVVEFFTTRMLEDSAPTLTIADADVVGDTPPSIYDLDEATVVTSFVVEQQVFGKLSEAEGNKQTPPPDGIKVTPQAIQIDNGDTTTFSTRIVEYKLPGMVHEVGTFIPTLGDLATDIAREGFDRFGRGAPSMEVQVLRTSAAASAQIGDLVYLTVGYFPNKNYRIGESSVGARVAQIVRREERPEGPMYKLVDAGVYNQPSINPTISIAASTSDPRRVAEFTVTNAAAINNTADVTTAIEYATGASAPASGEHGTRFTRYAPLTLPTVAVALPAVTPGSTVYVRARTEQAGLFPSAWTAWQSVALTAWSSPTITSVGSITNGSAVVTWTLGGNTLDSIDVFVAPGSTAPSSWQGYRINSLPAGSTSTTITGLSPSAAYIVAVAFRDAIGDTRGAVDTETFSTTGSTSGTAPRPAGFAIIPGINDATLTQGVVLALWQAAGADTTLIERAPDVAGVPGTYDQIAQVSAYAETYLDYLPRTGATVWYRIRHERSGEANSAYMPAITLGGSPYFGISAVATGIPPIISRPDAVSPVIAVTTDESGSTATVTLTITDSQYRVTQVRFRERTNGGAWSAYTVDTSVPYSYSATIPAVGFVDIEYEVSGYNAAGIFGVLASGQESFDADTNATIVSASGTFSLAGALTLSVQGDTDTNSFKYAVATTNWADDAAAYTAAQAGTLVNARNSTITLAGPYSVGTTVYVAIAGYTGASASGTVSGPYRYAFINGSQDTIYSQCLATQTGATDTTVTVQVSATSTLGTPQVRLKALAGTATASPVPSATLYTSPSTWTFTRGAFDSGPSQAEFEAVLAGTITDADFIEIPEQGRDTVPLTSRARVTATSNTQVTVRYAVADPFPQGANSVTVAYQNLGTAGVTPASGGTITPAATLTEAAGTYIDYTIDRPAFSAGAGRVTFTATAANRVSDQDAVDVPAVERDTVPLLARARLFSVSATESVVRVAVACAVAPSPNSATIAYSLTGLSSVSPATGQTVTPELGNTVTESAGSYVDFTIPRPAAGAAPGRITFTVTATDRVAATDAADIVAQDIISPSLKVVTTPSASSYSLVITFDGTIAYDLDGVSQSVSGWTSPRTEVITRNDYLGATKVAAFNVTKNSITVSESINVPPKDNSGASITIGVQTADDVTDDYEFSWTPSGFPSGTEYNLTYTTTTTAGVIEQGSLNNQTSPITVASGYNIGASPTYQMRIDAIKSGTLILTQSRSGTFTT